MTSPATPVSRFVALLPRHGTALLALICIAGTIGYGISRETPVGSVHGRVVLGLERRPFAGVKVTLTSNDADNDNSAEESSSRVRRVRAITDANGEFEIHNLPAGTYSLSAYAKWHSVDEKSLWINEKETTDVPLHLQRSEPDLIAAQQQKNYLASERLLFPIRGYVDGGTAATPIGANTVTSGRSQTASTHLVSAPVKSTSVKIVPIQQVKSSAADTVRIRVFKTTLSDVMRDEKAAAALSSVGDRYSEHPRLPRELLHPTAGPAPRLISDRSMPITQADNEGFFHQRFDLGMPGPGLYLMDATHVNAARGRLTVTSWALVSDIALVVKKSRGELLACTVHTKTGKPQPAAEIRVLRDSKLVATSRADASGLARIRWNKAESEDNEGRLTTIARLGAHEATVGVYDYESEEGNADGGFTMCAYTDRPIYRPGGRVQYKGIVRRAQEPGIRYAVPAGQTVDFEVRDPQGERLLRRQYTTNRFGSFAGSVELSPEAPTGTYTMAMSVAGGEHTESFVVASYKKPEFTATVTANQQHYTRGEEVEMFVAAQFYFGAPVAGAKVSYSVLRAPDWSSFYEMEYGDQEYGDEGDNDYSDYEDAEGDYSGSGETVKEGTAQLDENGHAIIRFTAEDKEKDAQTTGDDEQPEYSDAPQEQVYTVLATVTDASGREVEAQGKARISAGDFRLSANPEGYVAAPGKATMVTLTARDFNNHPVPNVNVQMQSGYEKWNENTNKSEYTPGRDYQAVTGADGTARIEVMPSRRGEMRLEAIARDKAGRVIQDRATLWVADDSGGDFDAQYSDLSLLADKKRYQAGDVARVLINSERTGQSALLSIEGSKIFRAWLVPLTRRSTVLQVPVSPDYGPNVVLSACTVRDKKFAQSSVPLRVDVPEREVKVTLHAGQTKYTPGAKITYQVRTTDKQGKPLPTEVSFGVVDEAIYALREDDPRLLKDTFYPHRYNSVQTSYSFEPMYLGDADKAEPVIESRKKFLDTAFWQPTLQTDATGQASVSFDLPDNLTTWRATAIAQTTDSAFGRQIQKTVVAKDFLVRLETPRFVTGGDASSLIAFVHNDTGKEQTATVKLDASGVKFLESSSQTVALPAGNVGQVQWSVSSDNSGLDFAGIAHLKVTAWTEKSPSGEQYTDGIETTLPVRPHGREKIQRFAGQVTADKPVTHQIAVEHDTLPAFSRVTVRIAPSITDALVGALDYLIGFPYGCTEQTMSRFLPDILVQRMLRLSHTGTDERTRRMQERLPRMVRDGLTRLSRFQHESGGWGWWENDEDDPWMTAYVLYGLTQAKREGYAVSPEVLARGQAAARKMLDAKLKKLPAWQQEDAWDTRAFMLYVLALCGDTKTTYARRLQMKTEALKPQSLAWLVLLDKQLGLKNTSAWPELEQHMVDSNDGTLSWQGATRDEWSDWNDRTATALGLQALLAVDRNDVRIEPILLWLMTSRTGNYWGSTRDTTWVMSALCDYLSTSKTSSRPGKSTSTSGESTDKGAIDVRLNGRLLQSYEPGPSTGGNEITLRVPWQSLRSQGNSISIECHDTQSPVFYSVESRQTVAEEELLALSPPSTPITVTREYRRVVSRPSGANDWTLQTEPIATSSGLNRLQQGDRIRVRLTINTSRDMSYVLIEDAFPAGCEVTERGSADEGNEAWDNWWSNTDVRDDRVAFFANHLPKGRHIIEYNLRAQTPGSYRALPVMLQAMYAPDVRAESAEARVEVQ